MESPRGTAVDQSSGDLYVADRNNFRIDKFDAEGHFLMAWGFGVADGQTLALQTCGPEAAPPTTTCFFLNSSNKGAGNVAPESVAVEQSTHDVYVADSGNKRITKFSSTGQFLFMFGKNVNTTPGTPTPNLCTAVNLLEPGNVCGAGAAGNGATEFFTAPTSVIVDSANHVWVGDTARVIQFDSSGGYVSQAPITGGGATKAVGIDPVSGDFYVKSASLTGVRRYTPSGTPVNILTEQVAKRLDDSPGLPEALVVDAAGNVYVGDKTTPYRFMKFNPSGEQVGQFGAGQVIATPGSAGANPLAIGNSAGALYVASSAGGANSAVQRFSLPAPGPLPEDAHATNLLPTTATLAATLNPEGHATTYHFDYGTSDGYGQTAPTPPLTLPAGFNSAAVSTTLSHLLPATEYHFRLSATNNCNSADPAQQCTVNGEDATFTTPPAVQVDAQWATDVASTSAILKAELDPLGVSAEWWLEYGTDEGYGASTVPASLGSGFGAVSVASPVTGLQPGTIYHYRFAARDVRDGVSYTVHGEDRTITTQLSGLGFQLPDSRAWEMVSPPNKHSAFLEGAQQGIVQAAPDGEALAYISFNSIEAGPEGSRAPERSTVLARRGPNGWRSKDMTPPHEPTTPNQAGFGIEYKLFNPDLSAGLLDPRSGMALSPQASERTPYLSQGVEPPTYTPLVTGKEGFANVPAGTEFGGDVARVALGSVLLQGATADLSHVVLESKVALVAGAQANSIYEWSAGQLRPLSVLPGGAVVTGVLGSRQGTVKHAISEDGSRVFWSPGFFTASTALYLRDTVAGESVQLDVAQPGAEGSGAAKPVFQGANPDGTVVYFTDTQQLTEGAGASGRDLYRCEIPLGAAAQGCASLTDVSALAAGSPESGEVLGLLSGLSEDGTQLYFVAKGVLDNSPNQMGQSPVSGQPNLYFWQQGQGTRFIATLSGEDRYDWGQNGAGDETRLLAATSSPSGRYLSFMSERGLTGYDNRDVSGGEAVQEAFRYDAAADRLACVSCNPSGARPSAQLNPGSPVYRPVNPLSQWEGERIAAILPQATAAGSSEAFSFYRSRSVLDDGTVFFNSFDGLVPADSNGDWDVYEYRSTGTGSCGASSGGAAVARSEGGCVGLLSSGTGEGESAFLDASADGGNVFFLSPGRLSVFDEDSLLDVYDARVDGVPGQRELSPECLGEACQAAVSAPNDPTPASSSFEGPGNVRGQVKQGCAKGKRKVRRAGKSRCVRVRHAKKKGGAKQKRRAARHRRAHR